VLASFRTTQSLLVDLLDAPDEVERLANRLTTLWLSYYDALAAVILPAGRGTTPWAAIWHPGRCYMLQCDLAYMISSRLFERTVMPFLSACCNRLDGSFYHMDGKGQIRHLDLLLSLKGLHGIQWVPGDGQPPPEAWLPLLERIRRAGKLCQLNITAEGARRVTRALGGRGCAFWIKDRLTPDAADTLVAELAGTRRSS
jgi:5-methyltetrahydrofolate--homocysteine methyltransferase